jgi:hypothetical protein
MKEICETLFCFWLKCFKFGTKKVQVEYTKMLPKVHERKKIKTEFFTPLEKNHSTLKYKESDELATKLSIVEEEIIFPTKYLNLNESDFNFKFEFTKKNIINFIETEINDKTEYKPLVNKEGFDLYIKESGSIFSSEIPMIKMFYKLPKTKFKKNDTNVKLIEQYMDIPAKRLSWDSSIKEYKIIEKNKNKEEIYLLYTIYKSPIIFVSERDVIEKRYDFFENDIYYDFASSVKDDYAPINENIVRITNHCSMYKMYEEGENINFISITQIDTKYKLPKAMMSYQLPLNYKKWYDSLLNSINEEIEINEQSELSEQNEQSSERLTSAEKN